MQTTFTTSDHNQKNYVKIHFLDIIPNNYPASYSVGEVNSQYEDNYLENHMVDIICPAIWHSAISCGKSMNFSQKRNTKHFARNF